jgi:hypothetical protein
VIFLGFLMTSSQSSSQLRAVAEPEEWRAPEAGVA